jgi:FMN phosphatase YigB (HAD superfamily)
MPRVGTTVVFSEDALAPGSAALWRAALEHLQRRYAAIRELDLTALPGDRTAAAAALDAWDGGAGWRREVGRFYDDHARLHLRRDPATGALLRRLRADGSRLGAYGAGPREASEAVLRFLGLDRRLDAVCLEDEDGFAAACAALGIDADAARHVRTADEALAL